MTTEHGYNLALADSRERAQRELKLSHWLKQHQRFINAKWKQAEHERSTRNIATSPAISDWDNHTLYITVTVRELEGLKDPVLEQVLTPFIDAPNSRCTDFAQYLNRDYHFEYPVEGGIVKVSVSAYVKEENPTCRKILVSRETVPQVREIFALSCEGDIIEGQEPTIKLENQA